MTGSSAHERDNASTLPSCAECAAPLAHDQRYCVECGARRGGLSGLIAERIRAMLAAGGVAVAPLGLVAPEPLSPAEVATASTPDSRSMPSPRASAVAIMAMLAFGVVVGSFASSAAESPGTVFIAAAPPAAAPVPVAPVPTPASSSGGGGSAPSQSAGSSSSGGGSGAGSGSPSGGGGGSGPAAPSLLPPVKHVFVIMLSDQGYDQTFNAPRVDPYLAKTLRKQGELLPNYYAVASGELANEIALISGQGPTAQTAANCPRFADVNPGVAAAMGQVIGSGCVYPSSTLTLAGQLTTAKKSWKAYVQDMSNGPHGQPKTCRRPALGSVDAGQSASRRDPYVTWSNPFVYFHSITKPDCVKDDVGLTQLTADLKTVKTTPAFSYIVPNPCSAGSDQPCVPNAKSGLAAADAFLQSVVPKIERSPAYKADGLIAITFDQAPQTGPYADASACCDNPTQYPNLPTTVTTPTTTTPTTTTPTTTTPVTTTPGTTTTPPPTTTTPPPTVTVLTTPSPYPIAPAPPTTTTPTTTTTTPTTTTPTTPTTTTPTTTTPTSELTGQTTPTGGGGEVGLLLISQFVKPNSLDALAYFNHYSLLSSIEQLFGLKRLGYARDVALPAFAKPEYNNYTP